ncbi:DUF262 domain-containing protein [Bacillus litorisediminis]|uniref:DUF262 domain-containing protein n=1 Tax=Bacillus litorisediminis TaxID=2922713 RepID=UPI001FADB95F|nr:DUF262 domain-containing protein [Bacillus litorisediminis]
MAKLKETKVYNINDFLNWYETGELEISPKYQRNPVWNQKAKSYLIDSIIRGLPVPQIFVRQIIDTKTRKTLREVIDGQQRLRTIIEFVNNEFAISKSHNPEYGNMKYQDLEDDIRENFLTYELPVEIIKAKEDAIIYDLFSRVNTNSMTLNKQELRNAKYWGEFKVFVYRSASKWREFFIDINMFNDKQLSRMNDAEFLSSLIITLIDGIITESSTKIDSYYEKFDEEFPKAEEVEYKLNEIMNVLVNIFNNDKFTTQFFHRKNYFFTLFSLVNHLIFGIDLINCETDKFDSSEDLIKNIDKFIKQLMEFESYYERFMNEELYDKEILPKMIKFEQNHRTRTTSYAERKERIEILCNFVGSGLNG